PVQSTDTCPVLITFGAHVSRRVDWAPGLTATDITGSPYHVALVDADGTSIGQKDNQMQAGAIGGTLTLVKSVINDNGGTAAATDWTLIGNGPIGSISGVTGSQAVTSAPASTGTWNLTESGPVG